MVVCVCKFENGIAHINVQGLSHVSAYVSTRLLTEDFTTESPRATRLIQRWSDIVEHSYFFIEV